MLAGVPGGAVAAADLRAQRRVPDDDEHPALGAAGQRRVGGGVEDGAQLPRADRVGPEAAERSLRLDDRDPEEIHPPASLRVASRMVAAPRPTPPQMVARRYRPRGGAA